jgi:hypothetical protein
MVRPGKGFTARRAGVAPPALLPPPQRPPRARHLHLPPDPSTPLTLPSPVRPRRELHAGPPRRQALPGELQPDGLRPRHALVRGARGRAAARCSHLRRKELVWGQQDQRARRRRASSWGDPRLRAASCPPRRQYDLTRINKKLKVALLQGEGARGAGVGSKPPGSAPEAGVRPPLTVAPPRARLPPNPPGDMDLMATDKDIQTLRESWNANEVFYKVRAGGREGERGRTLANWPAEGVRQRGDGRNHWHGADTVRRACPSPSGRFTRTPLTCGLGEWRVARRRRVGAGWLGQGRAGQHRVVSASGNAPGPPPPDALPTLAPAPSPALRLARAPRPQGLCVVSAGRGVRGLAAPTTAARPAAPRSAPPASHGAPFPNLHCAAPCPPTPTPTPTPPQGARPHHEGRHHQPVLEVCPPRGGAQGVPRGHAHRGRVSGQQQPQHRLHRRRRRRRCCCCGAGVFSGPSKPPAAGAHFLPTLSAAANCGAGPLGALSPQPGCFPITARAAKTAAAAGRALCAARPAHSAAQHPFDPFKNCGAACAPLPRPPPSLMRVGPPPPCLAPPPSPSPLAPPAVLVVITWQLFLFGAASPSPSPFATTM